MSLEESLLGDGNGKISSDEYNHIEEHHLLATPVHLIDSIKHAGPATHAFRPPEFVDVVMQEGAKPGEYISLQAARESNQIRFLGIRLNFYILVSICFLTFGSYWVFDTPGAIENQLKTWFGGGYGDQQNNILYSVYSFPNMVLALFGGYFVDRLNVRKAALLFCSLVLLGELVFCMGVTFKIYAVAVIGRFIFGLGGESLTVAQNTYTVRWFDGNYLALVFGLVVAFSRIGTSVNFIVTPTFAAPPFGVPFSVWFGCAMCGVSLTACVVCAVLDSYGTNRIAAQRRSYIGAMSPRVQEYIAAEDLKHEPKNDEVNLKDLRYFPLQAWVLYLICMFFYIAILTFNTVAQTILTHTKKGPNTSDQYSDNEAGLYMSIPSFVAIAASPFFGWLVDRSGHALWWICGAASGMCFGHVYYLLMAYEISFALTLGPIPAMIWIGIFYSMGASALWPILAYILDKSMLGTGYGAMTAVQNFGLAIFPLIIGAIQNAPGISGTTWQYTVPIIIFIGCAGTALLLALILIRIDAARGKVLNASAAERSAKKDAEKERQNNNYEPSVTIKESHVQEA
jgi:MFS family permease